MLFFVFFLVVPAGVQRFEPVFEKPIPLQHDLRGPPSMNPAQSFCQPTQIQQGMVRITLIGCPIVVSASVSESVTWIQFRVWAKSLLFEFHSMCLFW